MADYLNIKKNEDIDVNIPLKSCIDTIQQQVENNASQILTNQVEIANNTTSIDKLQRQINNLGEAVPPTRKINGKALSQDITLTASDVDAVPTTRKVNNKALSSNISLTYSDVGAVPTSRTVCGKALSSNITLSAGNVGAVPTSRTVNGKALSANISLTASNVGAISTSGGTISGQLNFSGSNYPQIYGNGTFLQLGGANNDGHGVVIDFGRPDDSTALRPSIDAGTTGHMHCGNANHRWRDIYSRNGTIQTSDKNAKNNIEPLDKELAKNFIMGVKPSTYKFNNSDSGRTHWGMISQDIEELLSNVNLTSMDFAGFIKSPKTEDYYEDTTKTIINENGEEETVIEKELKIRTVEDEYIYSLRYDEFIAPIISVIQSQQKEIEELKTKINELENR